MSLLNRTPPAPPKTAAEEVADAEAVINGHLARKTELAKQLTELEATYAQAVNDGDLETGAEAGQKAAVVRDMLQVLIGTIEKATEAAQPAYKRLALERAVPAHTRRVELAAEAARDADRAVELLRAAAQESADAARDAVAALNTARALAFDVEESAGVMNREYGITVGTVPRVDSPAIVQGLHRTEPSVKWALEAAREVHQIALP